jgi:hypothetical protein
MQLKVTKCNCNKQEFSPFGKHLCFENIPVMLQQIRAVDDHKWWNLAA